MLIRYILLAFIVFGSCVQADEYQTVKRVVDGDTLLLSNKQRVRMIGVDTPESVHPSKPVQYYGKEASAFTKHLTEGKRVRLEQEWQPKDNYGRRLAYVFLEDGTFVNAEIIKQGFGFAYTKFPFKYLEDFRAYERQAREQKRGLWADEKKFAELSAARAPLPSTKIHKEKKTKPLASSVVTP